MLGSNIKIQLMQIKELENCSGGAEANNEQIFEKL